MQGGASKISAEAFSQLVAEHMHLGPNFAFTVEVMEQGLSRIRLEASETFSRPGGTISGPTLFALADLTLWAAVLTEIGIEPLTVTADMSIHFLRRPRLEPLICEATILKCGRKLVHGDMRLWLAGSEHAPVCHATGTYARP